MFSCSVWGCRFVFLGLAAKHGDWQSALSIAFLNANKKEVENQSRAGLLLGNMLHFCLLWFSGTSPHELQKITLWLVNQAKGSRTGARGAKASGKNRKTWQATARAESRTSRIWTPARGSTRRARPEWPCKTPTRRAHLPKRGQLKGIWRWTLVEVLCPFFPNSLAVGVFY